MHISRYVFILHTISRTWYIIIHFYSFCCGFVCCLFIYLLIFCSYCMYSTMYIFAYNHDLILQDNYVKETASIIRKIVF